METASLSLPLPKKPWRVGNPNLGRVSRKRRTGGINSLLPGAMFNVADPAYYLKRESAVHVTAAQLASQGYNNTEIGEIIGRHKGHVSQILRQPNIQTRMINDARKHVQDELKDLLESRVIPNVKILASIADNPEAKAADRINAVNSMDNRLWGNPKQPIVTEGSFNPNKATPEELDRKANEILSRFVGAPALATSNGHIPTDNSSGISNPSSTAAEEVSSPRLEPMG